MASPKKNHEAVIETPEIVKEIKHAACGHITRHHYNAQGALEDLACVLPASHAGDHSAPYMKSVGEPVHDEKGRVVKTVYHEEQAVAYWNDSAGKPANRIREGEVGQMTLMQKDLVMQMLGKEPDLPIENAITKARALPQWNSLEDASS